MNDELSRQVTGLVSENQHLRVKSDNDDLTINLLKQQYAALSESVDGMRSKFEREIHTLRTERDQAVVSAKEIDTVLMQAADLIVQAARARVGNITPERMPQVRGDHLADDRLPIARLSS